MPSWIAHASMQVTLGAQSVSIRRDAEARDEGRLRYRFGNVRQPIVSLSHYSVVFENVEHPPGTRKVENHAISGQSSRQNDLTRGENETGCRRRDVDNKDVSTTGLTLSRSRSNESRQVV